MTKPKPGKGHTPHKPPGVHVESREHHKDTQQAVGQELPGGAAIVWHPLSGQPPPLSVKGKKTR